MSINYNNIEFQRCATHFIAPRARATDDPQVEYSDELTPITPRLATLLRVRLADAFGTNSKAVRLSFGRTDDNSFYGLIKTLFQQDDSRFLATSQEMADMLAIAQEKPKIPGGVFLLFEGRYLSLPVYVVFKAEHHDALNINGSHAEVLEKIVLSPTQKLFKAAVFYQAHENYSEPSNYEIYLADSQYSNNQPLARYFYETFLGLTTFSNSGYLTNRFYCDITQYAKERIETSRERQEVNLALRVYLRGSDSTISPVEFINTYLPESYRDVARRKLEDEYPPSFDKDLSDLDRRLTAFRAVLLGDLHIFSNSGAVDRVELDNDSCTDEYYVIKAYKHNADRREPHNE